MLPLDDALVAVAFAQSTLAQTAPTLSGPTANPFAVLTFLAAPAILTNAAGLLTLSTANRLARASDRARIASTALLHLADAEDPLAKLHEGDFQLASRRAELLVRALRTLYLASGSFAAGTCVALIGAFASYFGVPRLVSVAEALTIAAAVLGVGAIVVGSIVLVRETRIALQALASQHAAITRWRATRPNGRG